MRRGAIVILLVLLLDCLGCTIGNEGNGSFFLTYGTTLEFGSRTQVADPKQKSSVTLNTDKLFGMVQAFYANGPVDRPDKPPSE